MWTDGSPVVPRTILRALPPEQDAYGILSHALKRFLNGSHRQEEFKFLGRDWHKAKLLVVAPGVLVLGIDEKANSSNNIEDFDEFSHGRHEQYLADSLTLMCFADRQSAQPDSRDIAGQHMFLRWGQYFRSYLTDVECEKTKNGFRCGSCFLDQDKGFGNSTFSVLPRGLPEKKIQRFDAAIKSFPVV